MKSSYVSIDVCIDCVLVDSGYESVPVEGQPEPWALYAESGVGRITPDYDPETDDGHDPFSWTPCDGCGSRLGGSRFRFAEWL